MYMLQDAQVDLFASVYFVALVLLLSVFLLNITLAIVTKEQDVKYNVAEHEVRCCLPLDPPRQRAEDAPNGKETAGPGRVRRGGPPCRSEGMWH